MFVSVSWLVIFISYIQYFFGVVSNISYRTPNNKKEDQKFNKRICHAKVLWILTNEKPFPKTISQSEFDYDLFTNSLRIVLVCDFSPSSFKLKRGTLLLMTKYVS